jgi:parallel beta-helix repeat protein
MSLSNCLNNKVRGNYLLAGCIRVEYSRNNEISGNTVINNQDGFALYLYHDFFNTIKRNTFQNCNGSISLSSSTSNKITRNNFINCGTSSAWFSNAFLNCWLRNYWGSVHLGPKIIHGELEIPRQWPYPPIVVRMIDVDPLPRQFPIEMP